ncbi:MAG: helicase, partial [Deltaproteobacteria bacterium]|nr:helicase [Deltaproteobacteria bacterium]
RERRPLELAELAQIAGRAGRFTRDGGFGTLRPLTGLAPRVAESIERHRFPPVHRLVWRNPELEFTSIATLLQALRKRPHRHGLRLIEHADDYAALVQLSRIDAVRDHAKGSAAVELLWEVCRIPDYRKLLVDSHVQLLAAIYLQLAGPDGRLDQDWMATRIRRLDDSEGDIDTLMTRIAFVRTWTYVTQHEHWVPDAAHWQEVTRQIEDRHSDALHERLAARFVDHRAGGHTRALSRKPRRAPKPSAPIDPTVVEASPFAALAGLVLPQAPGQLDDGAQAQWVQGVVEADFDAFSIDDRGRIVYDEQPLARLERGSDLLHPVVRMEPLEDLGAGAQRRLERRLQAWVRDLVEGLLEPMHRIENDAPDARLRGLLYQLQQGLGTVSREDAAAQLRSLHDGHRKHLRNAGVELGRVVIYVPQLLRARALRRRAALVRAWRGRPNAMPEVSPAVASVVVRDGIAPEDYLRLGYGVVADRAVRADMLERAHQALHALGFEPFALPPELGGWLGCRPSELPPLLRAMGYQPAEGSQWQRRRSQSSRRSARRRKAAR